jgi:predicted porin
VRRLPIVFLLAASAGTVAHAQTNVVLYGIVDTSVRYISSDNASGDHNVRMDNGAVTNSRFGFRGDEALGGGLKAVFKLEGGFNPDNGTPSSAGSLFNRKAYVGVGNNYGELTLGRQNTPMFDLLGDHFDPLTVGNYDTNSWLPAGASLVRGSNMIKYYGSAGPVALGLSHSFGEQPGDSRLGSQNGASLQFTTGNLSLGAGAQQTYSTADRDEKHTAYTVAASYVAGPAKLFGGFFHIRDNTGTTTAYFGANNSPAAINGGIAGETRKDKGYFVGMSFQASPAWTLTGAGYYDRSRNITVSNVGGTGDGKRYAAVALAEYSFSKRTQLYGTVDYNRAKEGAGVELAGDGHVITTGLGIRHFF